MCFRNLHVRVDVQYTDVQGFPEPTGLYKEKALYFTFCEDMVDQRRLIHKTEPELMDFLEILNSDLDAFHIYAFWLPIIDVFFRQNTQGTWPSGP